MRSSGAPPPSRRGRARSSRSTATARSPAAGCGQALFRSDAKFDSGSGWPSFDQAIEGTVVERDDKSLFMRRTEIVCSRCGGHLGHVFDDGPTETGRRYCVNSLSIDFDEAPSSDAS